jgi:hypothetical protein
MPNYECQVVGDDLWEEIEGYDEHDALRNFSQKVYDEGGVRNEDSIDVIVRIPGETTGRHYTVECVVEPRFHFDYVDEVNTTEVEA